MIFEFNGYKPVIHQSAFIHPQANVTGNVVIGKDVYVGPGLLLEVIGVKSSLKMVAMFKRIVSFICSQAQL